MAGISSCYAYPTVRYQRRCRRNRYQASQPSYPEFTSLTHSVNVTVHTSSPSDAEVQITIHELDTLEAKATAKGIANDAFQFSVIAPKLWSPSSPSLYNITVTLGNDTVASYTGFRTISRGVVDGIQRPLLNGEFTFWFGTLDQGYWPDGLHSPPSYEAMVFDLQTLKDVGYNMVRKHVSSPIPFSFPGFFSHLYSLISNA